MKTIGLLGGMSWESTLEYYRIINEQTKIKLGKLHSAKIAMVSVDFNTIESLQHKGDWDATAKILSKEAKNIQDAGADFLLICTNTMHKVAKSIEDNIEIPILHIADATGEALVQNKVKKVGLLGTAFTMEQDFYKDKLRKNFSLEVVIPESIDRQIIHRIIYEELCFGKIEESSKKEYLRIVDNLLQKGCESIILGCTEIGLLIKQEDVNTILYDTTLIHAKAAVNFANK
jgi:aspartate racemase